MLTKVVAPNEVSKRFGLCQLILKLSWQSALSKLGINNFLQREIQLVVVLLVFIAAIEIKVPPVLNYLSFLYNHLGPTVIMMTYSFRNFIL